MDKRIGLSILVTALLTGCSVIKGGQGSVDSSVPSASLDSSVPSVSSDQSEPMDSSSNSGPSSSAYSSDDSSDYSEQSSDDSSSDPSSEQSESAGQSSESSSSAEETERFTLIDDLGDLGEGDIVVFGVKNKSVLMGSKLTGRSQNYYFSPVEGSYESATSSFLNPDEDVARFTVGVTDGGKYTFTCDDQLLGSNGTRVMTWDKGVMEWDVAISSGDATIAAADYGRILYNSTSSRFTTYTSSASNTMILPQIYRGYQGERIYAESITISGENEVSAGKTATLSLSYSPSNTNVKTAKWESLSPNVATVDDHGVVTGVSEGEATIRALVQSQAGVYDVKDEFTVTVTPASLDAWTIMLYLCGNDLESDPIYDDNDEPTGEVAGLATLDISEILSAKDQPADVNFIIETGGAAEWDPTYGISNEQLGRYHVRDGELVLDASLKDASMGATSTFQSFLEWGLKEYPAEKTGVILWNHGGGLGGVCYDENHNDDSLSSTECLNALKGAFAKVGRTENLEFIGYDACLMQVQDLAVANADYFNYMVGSQESEGGEGWCYADWLPDLYAGKPTTTILESICDSFVEYFDREYPYVANNQTQSYLDLSKAKEYHDAFEEMAGQIKKVNKLSALQKMAMNVKNYADLYLTRKEYQEYVYQYNYPTSWFTQVSEDGQTYYLLHGYYLYGLFDVVDFLDAMAKNTSFKSIDTSKVRAALGEFVGYNVIGEYAGASNGLSLVLPISDELVTYSSNGTFPVWRGYVG